jgi:hypothetical protein
MPTIIQRGYQKMKCLLLFSRVKRLEERRLGIDENEEMDVNILIEKQVLTSRKSGCYIVIF